MACTALTKGRGLDCNRIAGGIKFIYFAVYDQVTSIPTANGEITDLEMGSNSLYRYTMPLGVASLTDTIAGSRENGTIFYKIIGRYKNNNICTVKPNSNSNRT